MKETTAIKQIKFLLSLFGRAAIPEQLGVFAKTLPIRHDWVGLCSDINSPWWDTYYWWRCANCKAETKHIKKPTPKPSANGCTAKSRCSIFPLAST